MFLPVVAHLTGVPHDPGDPFLNTWILWWNATVTPFTGPWWNGPAFWPLQGSLAFSEHLVGLSVFTTPLIWMGVGPATAYSIVFLLSWPLSALSAHLLAYRLTGRHDAGFVAGLIFGFNPYRVAQTAHLQLLVSWWMPLALVALHEAVDTAKTRRRAVAAAIFGMCWLLQVLSNGYLLFYFSVLVALWLAWYATRRGARIAGLFAMVAWIAAGAAIVPVLLKYRDIHAQWGLHRTYGEIAGYSGDLLSFFTSSSLAGVWRLVPVFRAEQELYPGVVAVLMVIVWVTLAVRQAWAGRKHGRIFWILLAVGVAYGLGVALTLTIGPWSVQLGPFSISGSRFRKPLTISLLFLVAAMFLSPGAWAAFRVRSTLLFAVLATIVCWLMCLGPVAREWSPYWWLIELPGFNALRVPTRFAVVATLTLAIAAAAGFARFVPPRARWLAAAILLALLVDSWPRPIPTMGLPESYRAARRCQGCRDSRAPRRHCCRRRCGDGPWHVASAPGGQRLQRIRAAAVRGPADRPARKGCSVSCPPLPPTARSASSSIGEPASPASTRRLWKTGAVPRVQTVHSRFT